MLRLISTLCLASFTLALNAQSSGLFLHRNIQRAYDRGTRSPDGNPGANYWQNRANYVINASLEPQTRRLTGKATITYYNNSPDTLNMLRLKLAHDRYRKGSLRARDINPEDIDAGVEITVLKYNGQEVGDNRQRRRNTFLDILLRETPLPAHASSTIEVEWAYTMPADKRANRECVCDSTTFFVPYWYPQVAVYDDYGGWASTPYSGQQEFYHDFSDYDVTFTLPKGFMVWATGEWQNPEDLLNASFLKRFTDAHSSNEVVHIFTEQELKSGLVFRNQAQHTLRYIATDVPDFTFAASDHYNWDATSVVVDDRTRRRTFVSAAYHSESKDFYRVARIAADGIRLMSTWLPGYPFPYPCITVFNGNDGMEYPMMVNDASLGDRDPTGLTLHEVAHTYFPFMMGINEQEYAWMDEGWANFFHTMLTDSLTGQKEPVRGYSFAAGTDSDVPLMVRSSYLNGRAYGIASYSRPQAAYHTLLDLLGYETFHRCMTEYMDRWKGKHPIPYDFFNTWNYVSGQNLDWFWKPWFFEWGYPDLAVQKIETDGTLQNTSILVERIGNLPIPVHLEVRYADGSSETIHKTATVWKDGNSTVRITCSGGKRVESVELGNWLIPDSDRGNNRWSGE